MNDITDDDLENPDKKIEGILLIVSNNEFDFIKTIIL